MRCGWIILILVATCGLSVAQSTASDWAWKPIVEQDGVHVSYIFYSEADNHNNGVVIKLSNWNDYDVQYRFKVIFRTDSAEREEPVSGSLKAGESKTGDADGLFWVPFKDGRDIGEIGLRGFKISHGGADVLP